MFGLLGKGFKVDPSKIAALGAGLQDLDGTLGSGNFKAALSRLEKEKQQKQQQALVAQASQGLTPQQAALAQLNPQAFSNQQINNQFLNPLAVQQQQNQNKLAQNTIGNTQFQQGISARGADRADTLAQNTVGNTQFNQGIAARGADRADAGLGLQQQGFEATQQQRGIDNGFKERGLGLQQQQFQRQTGRDAVQDSQFQQQFGLNQAKAAQGQQPNIRDQIALSKFNDEQAAKAAEQKDIDDAKNGLLSDLSRLREGGDLSDKLSSAFGLRVPFAGKISGSDAANVRSTVKKITSNLTLDKIKNFKGAISDKDLEVAESAATVLQNANISDAEARREIERLFTALSGGQQEQSSGDFSDLSDDDLLKIINGG